MTPETSSCWRSKTAASGTIRKSRKLCRWSKKRFAPAPGRTLYRPPLPPYIARRPRPKTLTGDKFLGLRHSRTRATLPNRFPESRRALAMVNGPQTALEVIDGITSSARDLESYHLLHATRADLLRRMGSQEAAAKSYVRALELVTNESERRFLQKRLKEVERQSA